MPNCSRICLLFAFAVLGWFARIAVAFLAMFFTVFVLVDGDEIVISATFDDWLSGSLASAWLVIKRGNIAMIRTRLSFRPTLMRKVSNRFLINVVLLVINLARREFVQKCLVLTPHRQLPNPANLLKTSVQLPLKI